MSAPLSSSPPFMNKRLGMLFVAAAALMVGGVGFLVVRGIVEQKKRDLVERGLEVLPEVAQRIKDFRRVKIEKGRKSWEVAAEDARYFEDKDLIVVTKPVVEWYLDDGRTVGLRGSEGQIRLEDRDLSRVDVKGDIEVSLAAYRLRTEDATYDRSRGLITSDDPVEFFGKNLDAKGDGMEADLDRQTVKLLRNVTMRIDPAAAKQGD